MRRRGDRPVVPTLVNIMMTSDLKSYPAYKDSGVEWLGKVPAHWQVRKLRHTIRSVAERNRPDLPLLSVVREKGVVVRDVSDKDENHNFIPDDLTNYKVVKRHQFAMNKMKAWQGSYGVSNSHGIVSPAYFVFDIEGANPDYFHTAIRSKAYVPYFTRASDGVRIGQWDLSISRMREIPFLVPPVSEQTAIVRFLDHADRRIRRYIRAKQKLIALLEEQKQTIIHQAITRGIDAAISLKPTGNSWFPEVPDTWDVVPMGRVILRVVDGPHLSPDYLDKGIPFLSARNIKVDRWSLEDVKFISQTDYDTFCQRVKPEMGDVLYTKGGTTGVARAVDLDFPFQVWVHVAVLKVRKDRVLPHYLAIVLNTPRCYEQSQLFTRGATNQDLGLGRMKNIVLPLPPLAEQSKIIEQVMAVQAQISRGTHAAFRQIELLQEYRTRLIADVVTGKLDMREAAAELPEVDPLAEDDLDGTIHDGGNSNLGELNAEESAEEYTLEKEMPL